MEKGVLILECLDRSDPGSEGRFLSHMFDIMDVPSQYVEVRTPNQFISLMACAPYEFIHITTHGCVSKPSEKFRGWWTPNGKVDQKSLGTLDGKLEDTVVVSTACKSADETFGRYVVDTLGSRYYIAPITDVHEVRSYAEALGCSEAVLVYPIELQSCMNVRAGNIRVRTLTFAVGEDIDEGGEAFLSSLFEADI